LTKDIPRLDTREYFFSQRVVNAESTVSRTPTTANPAKIWTTEADQLASPSTYKYMYKYKYVKFTAKILISLV